MKHVKVKKVIIQNGGKDDHMEENCQVEVTEAELIALFEKARDSYLKELSELRSKYCEHFVTIINAIEAVRSK